MQNNIFNSVSNVHHHICALFDLVHLYCAYEAFDTWFYFEQMIKLQLEMLKLTNGNSDIKIMELFYV